MAIEDTVQRLINKNGRNIILIKNEIVSDPGKPWKGSSSTEVTQTIKAVNINPSSLTKLGQSTQIDNLVKLDIDFIYLFFPSNNLDICSYTNVRDNGVLYAIEDIQILEPGTKKYLGYIGVKK